MQGFQRHRRRIERAASAKFDRGQLEPDGSTVIVRATESPRPRGPGLFLELLDVRLHRVRFHREPLPQSSSASRFAGAAGFWLPRTFWTPVTCVVGRGLFVGYFKRGQ
jgi:hypothetical protein